MKLEIKQCILFEDRSKNKIIRKQKNRTVYNLHW